MLCLLTLGKPLTDEGIKKGFFRNDLHSCVCYFVLYWFVILCIFVGFLTNFCAYGNCGPTTDFSVSLFQNYIYNMKIEQIYVYTLLLNRSTALLSDIYVYNSALKVIRQKDIAQFNQIYSNCCLLDAWSCDLQL